MKIHTKYRSIEMDASVTSISLLGLPVIPSDLQIASDLCVIFLYSLWSRQLCVERFYLNMNQTELNTALFLCDECPWGLRGQSICRSWVFFSDAAAQSVTVARAHSAHADLVSGGAQAKAGDWADEQCVI